MSLAVTFREKNLKKKIIQAHIRGCVPARSADDRVMLHSFGGTFFIFWEVFLVLEPRPSQVSASDAEAMFLFYLVK